MSYLKNITAFLLTAAIGAGSAMTSVGFAAETRTDEFRGSSADNGDGTFRNPVLLSDVPDPDCIAGFDPDGNKAYYLISTTMSYAPGAPIMRSYDLVNWETVSYVYDAIDYESDALSLRNDSYAYGKGQWASSIRYHNGLYYVLFSSYTTGKSYIYTTKSIESGDWKKSEFSTMYHDPSLYIDSDEAMYIIYGGGTLKCVKLATDSEGFVSLDESYTETTVIGNLGAYLEAYNDKYDPNGTNDGFFILPGEGSHVYNVDGKVYILFISWPMEPINRRIMVCYQAKSLADGIENGFKSKIIFNGDLGYAAGDGVAQGGMMNTTGESNSSEGVWKAMICQDRGPIGRCPVLMDVTWEKDENGLVWPMLSAEQKDEKPIKGHERKSIVVSDDFTNGDKPNAKPAVTKAPEPELSVSEEGENIIFNGTCDGEVGGAPWFWNIETGKQGTAVVASDENDNNYMRLEDRGSADAGFFQWCNKPAEDEQYPATLPEEGSTYNISFKARYLSTSDGAPEKETVTFRFNDSVLASGEITADEWTTISGTYTFKDGEVGDYNSYRIYSENSAVDFEIDDVSVVFSSKDVETPDTDAGEEVLYNPGFEDVDPDTNIQHYWNAYPDGTAASIGATSESHSGNKALAITNRKAPTDGIKQYIELTHGFDYTCSAWVKSDEDDTVKMVLMSNHWKPYTIMTKEVKAGEWTKLTGSFKAPSDWDGGYIYIDTDNTTSDIIIDDASIKEVPGQILEVMKDGEGDYNGSNLNMAWQWNHNPDNTCWSLTDREGYLRLTTGKTVDNIQYARNTLTQRSYGPDSAASIKMDVSNMKNGDYAGMTTMQTKYGNIGVKMIDGKKYFVWEYIKEGANDITDSNWLTIKPQEVKLGEVTGNDAYVRLEYHFGNFESRHEDAVAYFYYSNNGENWKYAGKLTDLVYDLRQFTGYKFGIFNYATEEAGGYVDVDYFNVEDEILGGGTAEIPTQTPDPTEAPAPTKTPSQTEPPQPTATPVSELIQNGGMEGFSAEDNIPYYWYAKTSDGDTPYTAAVAASDEKAHSGSYSLKVSGRTASAAGAGNYFTQPQPGALYKITAYIYTDVTDTFHCGAMSSYWKNVNCTTGAVCKAGEWTELTAVVRAPQDWEPGSFQIWSESATADFYVDDVSMALYEMPEEFEIMTPYYANGKAVIRVTNTTSEDKSLNIYVARYDESNVLTSLKKESEVIAANSGETKITIAAEEGDKVYIWDDQMKPYIDPQKIKQITPEEYMAQVEMNITETEINGICDYVDGRDYGQLQKYQYHSQTAGRDTNVNVLLPPGYSEDKEYPVLYLLHGYHGNEDSLVSESEKIMFQPMYGNLLAEGKAEEMIVVFPYIFCSKDMPTCTGMNPTNSLAYDNFINDLLTDLMPFIKEEFSVKTGRENTAISGFSMGGRESLYIGMTRSDLFGYVGAVCPAPGLTPGTDLSVHPGQLQENELKTTEKNGKPYLLMISAAVNDSVVGDSPANYSNIMDKNGETHLWHSVSSGYHDGSTIRPHLYNYVQAIFKAE